jgi:class 3 adenylate cyclase
VVDLLNRLFSEFDRAADKHGMQKIKTIGDAYMAVGGLVDHIPSRHAARCAADFAFDMHRVAAALSLELGVTLRVRVGLHVGPVVAGVIGTSRPAFDCWGDTVNLASRLEHAASPGSVLISESAYRILRDYYRVEIQEDIQLKGIGLAKVYLLHPDGSSMVGGEREVASGTGAAAFPSG